MLTFLMLARLVSLCPAAVLQRLDRLVEPLKATCTTKVQKYMHAMELLIIYKIRTSFKWALVLFSALKLKNTKD